MRKYRYRSKWRQIRASWRDTMLLLGEFRNPLFLFITLVITCGVAYYYLSLSAGEPVDSIPAAIYLVLSLTFFQSIAGFPHVWYLQIFYFLVPFLGLGLLAQGLTDFGMLLFNRRARGKEWEMAIASTYHNHIILVGLGHLGYRVVQHLHEMGQDLVVIELKPNIDLQNHIHEFDIPIIADDATRESVLKAAGIQSAHTIILCTQNDSLNLQIAVRARSLNPKIQVVIRIFDDEFAESLRKQFGFQALSATGMAAPIFAASAVNLDITPPITIDGQPNNLVRFEIGKSSSLIGQTLDQLESRYNVSVVLRYQNGVKEYHPAGNHCLQLGDSILVLGNTEHIYTLANENR